MNHSYSPKCPQNGSLHNISKREEMQAAETYVSSPAPVQLDFKDIISPWLPATKKGVKCSYPLKMDGELRVYVVQAGNANKRGRRSQRECSPTKSMPAFSAPTI
jgi:hypothetical protein